MPLFNPSRDLTVIQNILMADNTLLDLLKLKGKSPIDIVKRITRKRSWDDLVTGERRLHFYFRPARYMSNMAFTKEVVEFNCHVPSSDEFYAYRVLERVHELINEKRINNRYMWFDGQFGELPTMQGFFCCGSKYHFYRII
jgi:hypothetical protein